jgi:hypothetical protein
MSKGHDSFGVVRGPTLIEAFGRDFDVWEEKRAEESCPTSLAILDIESETLDFSGHRRMMLMNKRWSRRIVLIPPNLLSRKRSRTHAMTRLYFSDMKAAHGRVLKRRRMDVR